MEHSLCAGMKSLSFTYTLLLYLMSPCEVVTNIIPNFQIQKLRLRKGHIAKNEQGKDSSSKSNSSPLCCTMCLTADRQKEAEDAPVEGKQG